jgi:hypothetical protein
MRSGRVSRLAPAAAVVLVLACGPRDAPDDQLLTSPHFRYHARADAVLDPTVMDRLEAFRGELDATFGIESPIVDYYLYRDVADLSANSPCPGRPCTYAGTEIQTSAPFHEHELVHALLSDVGRPASVVAEGIANHFACAQPRLSYEIDPAKWATAVGADTTGEVDFAVASTYSFGQRLVAWMLETGGTRRFLDFYGTSLDTKDAAIFALQFQRFWNRRLPDVAEELFDRRFQGRRVRVGRRPSRPTDRRSRSSRSRSTGRSTSRPRAGSCWTTTVRRSSPRTSAPTPSCRARTSTMTSRPGRRARSRVSVRGGTR